MEARFDEERVKDLLRAVIGLAGEVEQLREIAEDARRLLVDAEFSVELAGGSFCADERCPSCNGLGADGHHY